MRMVLGGLFVLLIASCSSTVPPSYLPVDSPLHAWAPPEHDETAASTPAATPAAPPAKAAPAKKPK